MGISCSKKDDNGASGSDSIEEHVNTDTMNEQIDGNVDHDGSAQKNDEKNELNPVSGAKESLDPEKPRLPSIFKLNSNCWEKILDWLSIHDLNSLSQTCRHIQRIAGEYFSSEYQQVEWRVFDDEISTEHGQLNGLMPFARKLFLMQCDPDALLYDSVANVKTPTHMELVFVDSTALDLNRMAPMLSSVEILTIRHCHFENDFFEGFLKLCVNLKRLSITKNPGIGWLLQKYVTLEHLELKECDSIDELPQCCELSIFFKGNTNVRSFSTNASTLMRYHDSLVRNKIELDDLTVIDHNDSNGFYVAAYSLHAQCCYKRLHVKTDFSHHLQELNGLVTLQIPTDNHIGLPPLNSVTEYARYDFEQQFLNSVNVWSTFGFENLESLLVDSLSSAAMMKFIGMSKKLKEIKMKCFNETFDIRRMNMEREKLEGACKLTIYVDEWTYLETKWANNRTDFNMIELKRNTSYSGIWDICTSGYRWF